MLVEPFVGERVCHGSVISDGQIGPCEQLLIECYMGSNGVSLLLLSGQIDWGRGGG